MKPKNISLSSFASAILVLTCALLSGQTSICGQQFDPPLSDRVANYKMDITLDHTAKTATGTQVIEWINLSPDTVTYVRMYMYLNAFKNNQSSFIKGAETNIFGQDIRKRSKESWGWVDAESIQQNGVELNQKYVHPDDDNLKDKTALQVDLAQAVIPGDTLWLDVTFESKLPKTIARSGYSRNDFFLFVHWYPKLGVYEKNRDGIWGWNCHQFLRQMEFYGDFGSYDVQITTSDHLVLGASGCLLSKAINNNATVTYRYIAEDVIDFAWTAYPDFVRYTEQWNHVQIELLSPPHHKNLAPRLIGAVRNSLEYLSEHVGTYPYSKITVMDPPAHATRNGFMEYPTFITGGSFYGFPKSITSMESLIVHEFSHQYFMGMLANNEKEEAWLDEGFVTFYEDEIMETSYGEGESLINILGYKVGNRALTRNEYTSLDNKRVSPITKPSYLIRERYRGIIYSKTALVLSTLKGILGQNFFDEIMRRYFDEFKFKHPRKEDFVGVVTRAVEDLDDVYYGWDIRYFLDQALDKTAICDFAVNGISNSRVIDDVGWFDRTFKTGKITGDYHSTVRIHRLGDFVIPVEIKFEFEDGSTEMKVWDAFDNSILYDFFKPVRLTKVEIDPDQKIALDIDFNNNSYLIDPNKRGLLKYGSRATFWVQNILQTVSFIL